MEQAFSKTILFPYTEDQLWDMLREVVRSELKSVMSKDAPVQCEVPGMVQKPLYKTEEVCQLFRVSRQTLHAWVKEGRLKAYKVKSRVFYLTTDIEKLLGVSMPVK